MNASSSISVPREFLCDSCNQLLIYPVCLKKDDGTEEKPNEKTKIICSKCLIFSEKKQGSAKKKQSSYKEIQKTLFTLEKRIAAFVQRNQSFFHETYEDMEENMLKKTNKNSQFTITKCSPDIFIFTKKKPSF